MLEDWIFCKRNAKLQGKRIIVKLRFLEEEKKSKV
jgi:hypothetical protein